MEAFIQQVRAPSGTACHLLLRMIKLLVNSSFLIKNLKLFSQKEFVLGFVWWSLGDSNP